MVIGRRSLLLAGVALPVVARAQCVTDTPSVDACLGGVRLTAPPGVTLDLSFMTPGTLPPNVVFTRASTATYFDSTGTLQTATANTPRWDYNQSTHALNGLLIEEARTNLAINSADASNASWTKANGVVAAPVVTGNQVIAPDGTTTAARVVYPAVSGAGAFSNLASGGPVVTANQYTWSVWLRGNAGGEQLYLFCTADAVTYYRTPVTLTTAWQRFSLTTSSNLTATNWFFEVGTDLRDTTGQTSKPAQTVFVWGAQIELGTFPTSYIATTAASVTRAADSATLNDAVTFGGTVGRSISVDGYAVQNTGASNCSWLSLSDGTTNNIMQLFTPGAGSNLIRTSITVATVSKILGADVSTGTRPALFKSAIANSATWSTATNGTLGAGSGGASTVLGPLVQMQLGTGGATQINGYLRRVRYWPRALSAAELQAVTT